MEYDWQIGDELICVDASLREGKLGLTIPALEKGGTYILLGWLYAHNIEGEEDWFVQVRQDDLEMGTGFRPERFRRPIVDEEPLSIERKEPIDASV